MFTYNDRDLHRMPTPARSHLPIKSFIVDSGLLDEEANRDNEADVALLRLPAPALRGTFAKAYELLTRLTSSIGWDELLRCRSQVFVMEEEYRAQKTNADGSMTPTTPRPQEEVPAERSYEGADVNASTTGIAPLDQVEDGEPSQLGDTSNENNLADMAATTTQEDDADTQIVNKFQSLGVSSSDDTQSSSYIPTIRVSSESDHEREKAHLKGFMMSPNVGDGVQLSNEASTAHEAQKVLEETGKVPEVKVDLPTLEKPAIAQAQAGATDAASAPAAPAAVNGGLNADTALEHHEQNDTTVGKLNSQFSFTNKRLCERWLDNLFMVLYEDLRVYTIWRAEVNHYKQQSIPYRKTSTEWEILGELALRLQHKEEAKDAFQRCVDGRFSAKAYLKLLDIYSEQKDVERSLWTALRLTAYHHRWYMENTFPGSVASALFRLIGEVGLAKVNFTLVSMSPPEPILKLMNNYFAYCHAFRVPGYDS
jgi:hypothetical protein